MKLVFVIFSLFLTQVLFSQQTISGKVTDNKGRPLIGVSISLKGSYDGALTDSAGKFSFSTSENGEFIISAETVGYKSFEQKILLNGEPVSLDISLKEELNELKAVTVTAGAFAAGDSKRATTVLTSLDVATVAGGNADITSAVKTLPGAQQIGEQEGLFVRGGAGYETKQFIDGTLVNNPYFTSSPDIASRGRFSPFLFKGTVFTTGGYSALYGEALSSALILESIDLPERSVASASLSPLFIGAGFQELAKNKKSSWGLNYSYVNVGLYFKLVKQKPDYFKMPQFHDADANFRIKTKSGGIIKFYSTYNNNSLGLRNADIDSAILKDAFSMHNNNWYNNLSWRENLGNGWKMNLGLSYSTNRDLISQEIQNQNNETVNPGGLPWEYKNFSLDSRQDLSQIKPVFEKRIFGISVLRFGGEYWYSVNRNWYNDTMATLKDNFNSIFAETDIYFNNNLAAKIGGRFEHSSLIHRSNIAPRISVAYKLRKGSQFSAAYGIFYQKPQNQQLFFTTDLDYTKATHYIVNYQKITPGRIFRVEAFYKKYEDLIKSSPIYYNYYNYNNAGNGYAKGLELFWRDKKSFKNFDYWISYSYLDTKREYLNYPEPLQPNFAAKHTASIVLKRFFLDIKTGFNFTYSYASGRPYYNLMYNGAGNKYVIADAGETKDYHSLGFSLNYVPSAGKINAKTFMVLVASVSNVFGYNVVYNYHYSFDGKVKQAVTPPAKRMYFIGIFLSWGVDRTQDAINNNL